MTAAVVKDCDLVCNRVANRIAQPEAASCSEFRPEHAERAFVDDVDSKQGGAAGGAPEPGRGFSVHQLVLHPTPMAIPAAFLCHELVPVNLRAARSYCAQGAAEPADAICAVRRGAGS
jgi:hypothetical protein